MIDMVTATLSTLLVPVFGLFFGWWILGEELTGSILAGSALVIAGIVVAQILGERSRRAAADVGGIAADAGRIAVVWQEIAVERARGRCSKSRKSQSSP